MKRDLYLGRTGRNGSVAWLPLQNSINKERRRPSQPGSHSRRFPASAPASRSRAAVIDGRRTAAWMHSRQCATAVAKLNRRLNCQSWLSLQGILLC
jgi:hypothetical protein